MTATTIIILIAIGMALVLAEIFLVPGTTIIGFAGAIMMLAGVVCGFIMLESYTAWLIGGGTVVVSTILGYLAFRSKTLDRFAVKSKIDGKIIDPVNNLSTAMEGITITPCNPIGKARFGEEIQEVYSLTNYLDVNTRIQIVNIKENKIFVQPI